jgi:5-methylcytosine-specific restriction endonuclease McrA
MAGGYRKYTEELLRDAVQRSTSVAGVLRCLDLPQAGGTHAHIGRTIKAMGIDTSHFVRHQGSGAHRRLTPADLFVRLIPGSKRTKPPLLRRALLEIGRPYACELCGNDGNWRDQPLRLEIDHIDGDYHNNESWNLRFLCPNCHTQTDDFSGRSRGKIVNSSGQLALFITVRGPCDPVPS